MNLKCKLLLISCFCCLGYFSYFELQIFCILYAHFGYSKVSYTLIKILRELFGLRGTSLEKKCQHTLAHKIVSCRPERDRKLYIK